MSALVLIFILVLLYEVYQYFDMYEISKAEIIRQQFDLDEANAALEEQQEKLTEKEEQIVLQQIKLKAAQQGLDDANAILEAQQEELTTAQTLLEEKETEITTQQEALEELSAQLTAQQTTLDEQQTTLDEQEVLLASQQELLEEQQQQIEALVGVRTRIISALSQALNSNHIKAEVDTDTGAITLESDVLFSTGKSDLSAEGRAKIDEFLPVYLNVLFSEEYSDYVAEIIIEGHTDSRGSYLENLKLSQDRALAVASYVLSDGYGGISARQKTHLRQIATANGRSYSDRIIINGVEDMDASRRVVFKFRLTDEQMIKQLQSILEENEQTDGEAE
jgi:chemotaxis protein MotB